MIFVLISADLLAQDIPDYKGEYVFTNSKAEEGNKNHVGSPLPGQVSKIFVSEGEKILKGDRVLVIEAMKMETTISAEKSGTIKKIYLKSGDNVETKDLLI